MIKLPLNIPSLLYIAIFIFIAIVIFFLGCLFERIKLHSKIKQERTDAVKRSRAVLTGQMAEQIAPFLPDFPCNPADVRFLGKPVDFVGFSGLSEKGIIDEVLLIEVKTGESKLNSHEKSLKSAIKNGKVRYVEYSI